MDLNAESMRLERLSVPELQAEHDRTAPPTEQPSATRPTP